MAVYSGGHADRRPRGACLSVNGWMRGARYPPATRWCADLSAKTAGGGCAFRSSPLVVRGLAKPDRINLSRPVQSAVISNTLRTPGGPSPETNGQSLSACSRPFAQKMGSRPKFRDSCVSWLNTLILIPPLATRNPRETRSRPTRRRKAVRTWSAVRRQHCDSQTAMHGVRRPLRCGKSTDRGI